MTTLRSNLALVCVGLLLITCIPRDSFAQGPDLPVEDEAVLDPESDEDMTERLDACPSYVPQEDRQNPHELAIRGVTCFESGEFLHALLFYRQAYSISKSALLTGAIGRSLQELGYPDLAREYYKSYLRVQRRETRGYQKIRARLDVVDSEIAKRATEVTIQTTPGDATAYVVLEGEYWEELGNTPVSIRLLPGEYRIVVRKTDFVTEEIELKVSEDQTPVTVGSDLISQDALFGSSNRAWRESGAVLMIASVPILAASGTLFVLSNMKSSEMDDMKPGEPGYDPEERDSAKDSANTLRIAGVITGATGGVALLTGVIFYVIGMEDSAATALIPYAKPNEAGFSVRF